jgi:hypothetical protein
MSKWFKQGTVQDFEIRKTTRFSVNAFDLIFLGWGAFTFYIVTHAIFKFPFPFMS